MIIQKWVDDASTDQPWICWTDGKSPVMVADPALVPELIAAVILLLGNIKNGIVQDVELEEDVKRIIYEMHGQYLEREGE